jgi:hypothetical protein
MQAPPSEGNVYHYVPAGTNNAEAWGIKLAWDGWQVLAGFVLDQAITDLQNLQGVIV